MGTLTFGSGTGTTGGGVGIPDLKGRPSADAEQRLKGLGLVTRVREIVTEGTKDTVFGLEPPAGSEVAAGSTVTVLVISTAPTPLDLDRRLEELTKAVKALETETAAKARYEDLVKRISALGGGPTRPSAGSKKALETPSQ
ncbi:PASTA domain-containing protein [Streptomyces sp. NPDC101118]|uniref:PASTA domain-containing protein n=1 Tax=Streptomyces sp. NPDC101118 TaxID=3366109 RepID=UPI0038210E53